MQPSLRSRNHCKYQTTDVTKAIRIDQILFLPWSLHVVLPCFAKAGRTLVPHRSLDEMLRATSLILGHGVPQATKTTIEFFKTLAVSGSTSQLFCRVHPNCRLFTAHSFPCCDFKPLRVINTWNMYFWCPCPARRAKSVGEEDLADVPVEQPKETQGVDQDSAHHNHTPRPQCLQMSAT